MEPHTVRYVVECREPTHSGESLTTADRSPVSVMTDGAEETKEEEPGSGERTPNPTRSLPQCSKGRHRGSALKASGFMVTAVVVDLSVTLRTRHSVT